MHPVNCGRWGTVSGTSCDSTSVITEKIVLYLSVVLLAVFFVHSDKASATHTPAVGQVLSSDSASPQHWPGICFCLVIRVFVLEVLVVKWPRGTPTSDDCRHNSTQGQRHLWKRRSASKYERSFSPRHGNVAMVVCGASYTGDRCRFGRVRCPWTRDYESGISWCH